MSGPERIWAWLKGEQIGEARAGEWRNWQARYTDCTSYTRTDLYEAAIAERDAWVETCQSALSERDALRERVGETRMCVNCGRYAQREHDRVEPLADCPSPDACTFDMTPDEAWQYWREKYHALRAKLDARPAVKVKPLVWETGTDTITASPQMYSIWKDNGGSGAPDDPFVTFNNYMLYSPHMAALGEYKMVGEAEAAAQADYEARILAALDLTETAEQAEARGFSKGIEAALPLIRGGVKAALKAHDPADLTVSSIEKRIAGPIRALLAQEGEG